MNCPNCKHPMQQVTTQSHYGRTLILDQCPICGGMWFDGTELYEAKLHDPAIHELDTDLLSRDKVLNSAQLYCPADDTLLNQFTDPGFPKNLILDRCPVCGGIWCNKGEFKQYQDDRKEKIEKIKENFIKDNTLDSKETGDSSVIGNVSDFLMTPVNNPSINYTIATTDILTLISRLISGRF